MPLIVTSIHDPLALTATCRRLNLPAPHEGCIQLDDQEVSGWIVRLPGVLVPHRLRPAHRPGRLPPARQRLRPLRLHYALHHRYAWVLAGHRLTSTGPYPKKGSAG